VDLATFTWLLTPEGQRLLDRATSSVADDPDPLRAATLLHRESSPDRAAAALTQARLRVAAGPKFGDLAPRMYFTPDGLEQATRLRVARHRAARVAAARPSSVLDLGCGIGGDLVALAGERLTVAGVDADPLRAAVAAANLTALGLPGAVRRADATALDLGRFGLVFADPARRDGAGRVFDVGGWSPPWPFVESLLRRTACVKVAPGLPHGLLAAGVEAEWVSDDGDVKEAALWSPQLATVARRATVLREHGLATLTDEDDPGDAEVGPPGRFLLEPDGAVVRAGLVTAVAAVVDGWLLDRHIAYLSTDVPPRTPFARGYEVLETLPFHEKRLRAALRARGVGRLTVKKRGVDVAPEQLRGRLSLRGDAEATVVLTRVAGRGTALLVDPL
jgi:SAM-dependent methyltransferase